MATMSEIRRLMQLAGLYDDSVLSSMPSSEHGRFWSVFSQPGIDGNWGLVAEHDQI
jgi:hypothetical protein